MAEQEPKQVGLPTKPEWKAIEAAAHAEAMALVELERQTAPELGSFVAWGITRDYSGVIAGFTPLHRVGIPIGDKPHTTCHEAIPDPLLRMRLSPALIRTMPKCDFCNANVVSLPLSNVA